MLKTSIWETGFSYFCQTVMNGSFNTSIGRAFEHLNLYFDSLHPLICDQQARKKPPQGISYVSSWNALFDGKKGWALESGVQMLHPHWRVESRWEEFMLSLQINSRYVPMWSDTHTSHPVTLSFHWPSFSDIFT